jgi:hypothetical protein
MSRRSRIVSDRLTRALLDAASQGLRPHCSDAAEANGESFGTLGGRDRTRPPGKAQPHDPDILNDIRTARSTARAQGVSRGKNERHLPLPWLAQSQHDRLTTPEVPERLFSRRDKSKERCDLPIPLRARRMANI